jgi:hypothetical protein
MKNGFLVASAEVSRFRILVGLMASLALCSCHASNQPASMGGTNHQNGHPDDHDSTQMLDQKAAEQWVLSLINTERSKSNLPALRWDKHASQAANRHVSDVIRHGLQGSKGSDGSRPEHRYTEAGGKHLVSENVLCYSDNKARSIANNSRYSKEELRRLHERVRSTFVTKKQATGSLWGKRVTGVGLAIARAEGERELCQVQEYVSEHAQLEPMVRQAHVGQGVKIAGKIAKGLTFGLIALAKIDHAQHKKSVKKSVPLPETYQPIRVFVPVGFRSEDVEQSPVFVQLNHQQFQLELPLVDLPETGMYAVVVYARFPDGTSLEPISLRTLEVKP